MMTPAEAPTTTNTRALLPRGPRRFGFQRDTFAFANELVWEYQFDGGKTTTRPREPKPDYTHHCFVLARAARQFFYHAHFDKSVAPHEDNQIYRRRIREVVSRNPRKPCAPGQEVVFPGYGHLYEFSRAHEWLLKSECGGAWQSYALRSHWRMIFPITRTHQERTLESLLASIRGGNAPVVHLVRFPRLTINHGVLLFGAEETEAGYRFQAYDPNYPQTPALVSWDRKTRSFFMPANHYYVGGRLDIIEIFRTWLI